jgi:1,2-diacylglycerol 3-alpha-glucosyltransferase
MKVVLLYNRFGPYHLARLKYTQQHFKSLGWQLEGLEVAKEDKYNWQQEGCGNLPLKTLFNKDIYEEIPKKILWDATHEKLSELQPDVVVINGYSATEALAAVNWCHKHQKISVLCGNSKENDAGRIWIKELLKSSLIKYFDVVLCSGTESQNYFQKLGVPNDCIFTGYNCVDNHYYSSTSLDNVLLRSMGLESKSRYFLSSNRFIERKNLIFLLKCYKQYRQECRGEKWGLLMVGDGPLNQELRAYVNKNGIENVHFVGFRQIDELPTFYKRASCYLHPALQDQWANVINEAMACSLPVIVSDMTGCAVDLVKNGHNGWILNPSDQVIWVEKMLRVSSFEEDELAAMSKASDEIIKLWGPDNFAKQLAKSICYAQKKSCKRFTLLGKLALTLAKRVEGVSY